MSTTRTHFTFRVDIWDDTGDSIVEHVSGRLTKVFDSDSGLRNSVAFDDVGDCGTGNQHIGAQLASSGSHHHENGRKESKKLKQSDNASNNRNFVAQIPSIKPVCRCSKHIVILVANFSRMPPSRPRTSARSVAPASRPGLCQPRIPEDRKERSASAVKRIGTAFAIMDDESLDGHGLHCVRGDANSGMADARCGAEQNHALLCAERRRRPCHSYSRRQLFANATIAASRDSLIPVCRRRRDADYSFASVRPCCLHGLILSSSAALRDAVIRSAFTSAVSELSAQPREPSG
jgi:hypothetical protein